MSSLAVAAIYLFAINAIAFWMFYWDKWCAENHRWRIPETNLLFAAMIGGSVGAIWAQQALRHKTRKEPFRSILFGIAITQLVVILALGVAPIRKAIVTGLGGAYRSGCVERFLDRDDLNRFAACLRRA